jgi:hypothetical protein
VKRIGSIRARLFVRRGISVLLVAAASAAIVVVDRQDASRPEGATAAVDAFAGFPQVSSGSRISTSWFCPGAAAGDGIESAQVVIVNPGDSDITGTLRILSTDPSVLEPITIGPRSRAEFEILRGRTVGVVVPVVELIGSVGSVEQELVYAAGDVTSQCVTKTSPTWLFADGFTVEGSTHRLVLSNPYPDSAVVNVAFTTADGERTPASLQGLILAPRSARSISLAESGARDERSIAVEVEATSGQIVASRIQHYLGGGRLGYTTTAGVPVAGRQWWFTSGRTGAQVSEQLVVFNPGTDIASVTVSFFGDGITNVPATDGFAAAASPSAEVDVQPGATVAIDTNSIADLPRGDHAMVLDVVDGPAVVAEHVLSQQVASGFFTAVTNGVPQGLVSQVWRVPSGLARGARNALAIVNTTGEDATFTVSAVGPGGEVELPGYVDVPLGPAAVAALDVPDGASNGEVVVRASTSVVIQRRTARGHGLPGFGIVGALPVRGAR